MTFSVRSKTRSATLRPDALLGRRVAGATLFACGAALLAGPLVASSETAVTPGSAIAITQTPYEVQGECAPGTSALSNTIGGNASTFVLRVTAASPLCTPIEAVAAVYAMPGNGVAWPQRLVETKKFTLSAAGVTEITFTKTCEPAQFDVLTGATPAVISPDGAWHGPLLFPLDTGTALQWWGAQCAATTTSVSPTSAVATTTTIVGATTTTAAVASTTSPNATTSTIPPSGVLTETTIKQSGATTTTTIKPKVLAENQTNGNGSQLAVTGTTPGGLAMIGGGMLIVGLGLMASSRRRLS